ncbi:MAG TPA: hypothetical protein VM580_13765 [Labilithrix sp.]|nr:hypothetical protein [Labilithrix sp.]
MWRAVPYALPVAAFLYASFGPLSGTPAVMLGFAAFAVFNVLGVVDFRQSRPRTAELDCGPGYIQVKGASLRSQRIVAKDIVGATTARTASSVLLTLQHRHRAHPITLQLSSEAEAEKIRHALGIGHSGFGVVSWRTQTDSTDRASFVGRIMALLWSLATIMMTLGVSSEAGLGVGILFGMFGVVGAMVGLAGLGSASALPTVIMSAEGLRLHTPRGWFTVPYGNVQEIEERGQHIFFKVPEPYWSVAVERSHRFAGGPSKNEREVMIAQIKAAAQRAHGFGPQKNDVTGRVDVLRRNGETARDWLSRLDMAGQMLSAGPGYRGNTLDVEDLWAILEDPDADADLRAAAARVLRHAPTDNARIRIDAAVAAVRDETTNRRLRIAVSDDLDEASKELALLDAESRERVPAQVRMQSQLPAPHLGARRV